MRCVLFWKSKKANTLSVAVSAMTFLTFHYLTATTYRGAKIKVADEYPLCEACLEDFQEANFSEFFSQVAHMLQKL